MIKLVKQPLFLVGFIFIFGLLIASFLYSWFWAGHVKPIHILYKSGQLVGGAPFSPKKVPPFGTDDYGKQLVFTILDGAKYTILFSLAIGLIRTVLGLIFGLIVSVTNFKIKSSPSTFFQALQTVPISLVLYFIFQPVIFDTPHYVYYKNIINYAGAMYGKGPQYSLLTTIMFETCLLTAISVPLVSRLFADEARVLLKKEFVISSRTLGSSKWFQIRKHVLPHLWSKVFVVFFQQIIQALLIIIHLGVLRIYFGGTYVKIHPTEIDIWGITNEWSGIIGAQLDNYGATPWMVLFPLLFFFLLIMSYNLILEGFNRSLMGSKKLYNDIGVTVKTEGNSEIKESDFKPLTQENTI